MMCKIIIFQIDRGMKMSKNLIIRKLANFRISGSISSFYFGQKSDKHAHYNEFVEQWCFSDSTEYKLVSPSLTTKFLEVLSAYRCSWYLCCSCQWNCCCRRHSRVTICVVFIHYEISFVIFCFNLLKESFFIFWFEFLLASMNEVFTLFHIGEGGKWMGANMSGGKV